MKIKSFSLCTNIQQIFETYNSNLDARNRARTVIKTKFLISKNGITETLPSALMGKIHSPIAARTHNLQNQN